MNAGENLYGLSELDKATSEITKHIETLTVGLTARQKELIALHSEIGELKKHAVQAALAENSKEQIRAAEIALVKAVLRMPMPNFVSHDMVRKYEESK